MANLKALNDDFIQLSSQTSRLEDLRARKERRTCQNLDRDIEKFRMIQEASKHAYGALSNSCTKHTEHLTHFCLEATAIEDASTPQVRFQLAFRHLTFLGNAASGDPVWFLIESIIGDATKENDSPIQLGTDAFSLVQTLKRQIDEQPAPCPKKAKKSVRFQSTGPPPTLNPYICEVESAKGLRNLCMRKNFCDQLRNGCLRPPLPNKPLGTLDEIHCHKHLVYFPPSESKRSNRKSTSLDEVISALSHNRLPIYERLHLARSLATAVLQYHATPWLRGAWRSEDILFFGLDEKSTSQQCLSLPAPHLNVCVKGPNGSLSRASTIPRSGLIRNPLIFGLGVVLLEIGHAKTMKTLQQPRDIRSDEDQITEYLVATRLASSIGRELGSNYGQIVQKCLYCDFGCGDDLNNPKLQAVFYQDVVKELEKLEDGFRKLQLGP